MDSYFTENSPELMYSCWFFLFLSDKNFSEGDFVVDNNTEVERFAKPPNTFTCALHPESRARPELSFEVPEFEADPDET